MGAERLLSSVLIVLRVVVVLSGCLEPCHQLDKSEQVLLLAPMLGVVLAGDAKGRQRTSQPPSTGSVTPVM